MRSCFDLAKEDWIPVLMRDGSSRCIGFRELFLKAHEIEGLSISNPLKAMAAMRILICLTHRFLEGPHTSGQHKELYQRGLFPAASVDSYFARFSDRFDLFSEDHPFMQTPGLLVLDKDGRESPLDIETLCFECINNKTVFEHHGDLQPVALSPGEAALSLLMMQYFALPGLAKKTVNIDSIGYQQSFLNAPLVSGISTILVGPSLFDTLCLNLCVVRDNQPMPETNAALNAPPWELSPNFSAGRTTPAGYFAYLAPISRHIRLVPELVDGRVLVRSVHITQGVGYETSYEPMYHWKEKATEPGHWFPSGLRADKALWRDSGALFSFSELAESNGGHRPWAFRQFSTVRPIYMERHGQRLCRCQSYGIANDQANPILWRMDSFQFPGTLLVNADLASLLAREIDIAEFLGSSLKNLVKKFAISVLSNNPAPKDVLNYVLEIGIEAAYWASLELPFKLFLSRIDEEESLRSWRASLEACAREAFFRCLDPSTAATGRRYKAFVSCERSLNGILAKQLALN